ncbi:hypothetical protein [Achromobacter pestifer]|uniref:hypothetical protein n=1 Tax=Achromobacter pestifer TaxID=1353889 RepID=UPI0015825E44|nr:hypothetical protein [Achromobacter pestifer]
MDNTLTTLLESGRVNMAVIRVTMYAPTIRPIAGIIGASPKNVCCGRSDLPSQRRTREKNNCRLLRAGRFLREMYHRVTSKPRISLLTALVAFAENQALPHLRRRAPPSP